MTACKTTGDIQLSDRNTLLSACICALLILVGASTILAEETVERLDNGMEIIFKENHNAPMVSSVIFVKSGSKYESLYENGITHFLEHLLFNGTTNLTREELDRSVRDLGGYLNAFTRKDLTAYFVLLPKQYIDYGLTVQADMLFNSVIPTEELAKERKVVVEEINSSLDSPGAAADEFFTQKAYAGTPYERPVVGYASFIDNIPRGAIIDYYKRFYSPDNMIMLLIGDFETKEMKKTVSDIFGQFESSASLSKTEGSDLHDELAEAKQRGHFLTGQQRYDTVANVSSTQINFSIAAPRVTEPDYMPFDMLTSYLALDETSPLLGALLSGEEPLATEAGVSLTTREELSRLEVSIMTERTDAVDNIISVTLSKLAEMPDHEADTGTLDGIRTSARCDAIYYAEKLHYYSFIIASMMMSAGWDFVQQYPDMLDSVKWEDCKQVASKWLVNPNYVVTVVNPADSTQTPFMPERTLADEIIAYFDSTTFPDYDLTASHELQFPDVDSVDMELVDRAVYHREVLENGLTVIVKSSQASKVFAACIIGKNRTANEPEGKAGITDFVNRCLENGTTNLSGESLAGELRRIGANLTLSDNPWIPYDDRYTTRRYSFIKFETIDRFAEHGFGLLTDLVTNPAFDSSEVESVRRQMLGVLGRSTASTSKVARNLFYETLFENHPFADPIMGSMQSLSTIGVDDLREHHRRYYAPDNMILTIATSLDTTEVMSWVRQKFGSFQMVGQAVASIAAPVPSLENQEAHHPLEKEQISIYAGGHLPGANHPDAVDLSIATSVLSNRLYLNLREKQGLAYSTGAGRRFSTDFGWYYLVISTAAKNYQKALDGLILQTEKLAYDGPTADEIRVAKNEVWGALMRAKLSRLNQAYYLGVDEFFGRDHQYDQQFLNNLAEVNRQTVTAAASKYFRPEVWVVATAGPRE